MKLILLVFIVILCSLIGYIYGEEYKNRYVQLQEMMRVLIDMQNEILYGQTPIPKCLEKLSYKSKEPVNKLLICISNKLMTNKAKDVYNAFFEGINEQRKNLSLKEYDYNIFLDLAKSLGETSIDGQYSIFTLAKEKLTNQINMADEECKKNRRVYRYLGINIGLMIAIFLI